METSEIVDYKPSKESLAAGKAHRKHMKIMHPKRTKEEIEYAKACRRYDKEQREYEKEQRQQVRLNKQNIKRELAVLMFMKKNDVKYFHHLQVDSMLEQINEHIKNIKLPDAKWCLYDPYIWNYQGEGNNYTSRCLLRNLWSSSDTFPTIYDVPLDGTYQFIITDSGSRGLGSYNYMQAVKTEEEIYVPKVNPGAFRPFGF